jgi:hypothetical protein
MLGLSKTMSAYGLKREEAAGRKTFIWHSLIKTPPGEIPGSGRFAAAAISA